MAWLINLLTPPGGVVCDPFLGSGSSAVAAVRGGFRFVGCEKTEEYLPIIEGRIRHAEATCIEAESAKGAATDSSANSEKGNALQHLFGGATARPRGTSSADWYRASTATA
jgi:hypothetical protein